VILQIFADERSLARAAASLIADRLRARPTAVLGLPSGRTPMAAYAHLMADTHAGRLDWSSVRTFNLDEFVGLGPQDPGSYRMFMQQHLFDRVNIDPARIEFPDGTAADLEAECRRYDEAIRLAGGIDLQVLGIGANGHIGFNEPGDGLDARTHRVTLRDETRAANASWFEGDVQRVPTEALSVGMASILGAREILLMATGEAKADAVAGMLDGRVTTWMPASFLQLHSNAIAMIDRAAAVKLTRRLAE
jgi:glucosamine-6-phosphate deaminase